MFTREDLHALVNCVAARQNSFGKWLKKQDPESFGEFNIYMNELIELRQKLNEEINSLDHEDAVRYWSAKENPA